MLATVREYAIDLFDLFYPKACLACSQKLLKSEEIICFKCESELPYANQWNNPENSVAQRFWGRVELQGAAALFQFQKGESVQHLLHALKYRGRQDAGKYMGEMLGPMLLKQESIIRNADIVVPVPLHWKKLRTRGYNQCDSFAGTLADILNIPFSNTALERTHENTSQTKINRFDRYNNVAEIFAVSDAPQLKGKHVLLADDVMTTGATAEACLKTILSVEGTKASFAAMAVALR